MDEYVSDAVEAGSAAFNKLVPWDFCHAFEDLSASMPVVAEEAFDIHIVSPER